MNTTEANVSASPTVEPKITSAEFRAWIARRDRFRARVKLVFASIAVSIIAGVLVFIVVFRKQIAAISSLGSRGIQVSWDTGRWQFGNLPFWGPDFDKLFRGGVSAASYQSGIPVVPSVDDLLALKSLLHLQILDFSMLDSGDEDLAILAELKELTDLTLSRTPSRYPGAAVRRPLTDKVLDYVKDLPKLGSLSLADLRITDAGLRKLTKLTDLESLDIDSTLVTDRGLDTLKEFKKLIFLRLENSQVTLEGVAAFRLAMPTVEVIYEKIPIADQY